MRTSGINTFFESTLGVPPANKRWSWGAVDDFNRRVFLRVWSDHRQRFKKADCIVIGWDEFDDDYKSPGIPERKRHLNLIQSGYDGYGVLCEPKFDAEGGRKIGSFDDEQLLSFGKIYHSDGKTIASISGKVPTQDVVRRKSGGDTLLTDLCVLEPNLGLKTQTQALILARIGQGIFRRDVLRMWGNRCAVTGCTVEAAIRASHIKPWSECDAVEKRDAANGLPLIANLDALFDVGLISFDKDGKLLVSRSLKKADHGLLGVVSQKLAKQPSDRTLGYLAYHRTNRLQR